jgi:hypothetical protein
VVLSRGPDRAREQEGAADESGMGPPVEADQLARVIDRDVPLDRFGSSGAGGLA